MNDLIKDLAEAYECSEPCMDAIIAQIVSMGDEADLFDDDMASMCVERLQA